MIAVAAAFSGAVGAVCRYLADGWVQARTRGPFPFGTLSVNLAGSLILGTVAGLALHHAASTTAQELIGVGFCGGLTTWSTASWETVRLVEEGMPRVALRYLLIGVAGSMLAAGVGLALA